MSLLSELHKAHAEVCLIFNETAKFDPRLTHQAIHANGEVARAIAEKLARQFAKQMLALGTMGTLDPNNIDENDEELLVVDIMDGFDNRFAQHFEDAEERAEERAEEERRERIGRAA